MDDYIYAFYWSLILPRSALVENCVYRQETLERPREEVEETHKLVIPLFCYIICTKNPHIPKPITEQGRRKASWIKRNHIQAEALSTIILAIHEIPMSRLFHDLIKGQWLR